jgi:hypothetical protein
MILNSQRLESRIMVSHLLGRITRETIRNFV